MPVDHPTPEEVDSSEERLREQKALKADLEGMYELASPELLKRIKQISSQTRGELPKWVTEPKWIEVYENLKSKLEKAIQNLEGKAGTKRQIESLQAQLNKVNKNLGEPREYLHGMSRKKYAQTISECPELENVDELVDDQYESTLSTLKTFGLYDSENLQEGDIEPPSSDEVKELLSQHLTPEQLEVIDQMLKPVLQLIPITSANRYLKALNSHKPMEGQQNAFVSDRNKKALRRADKRDGVSDTKIIGWKVAITEGVDGPEVLEGEDLNKTLQERIEWFENKYDPKGVSGVDFKRYILLQMMGLTRESPRPVDDWGEDITVTTLNAEPVRNWHAVCGHWDEHFYRVDLGRSLTDVDIGSSTCSRFRTSVVIDVPLSLEKQTIT